MRNTRLCDLGSICSETGMGFHAAAWTVSNILEINAVWTFVEEEVQLVVEKIEFFVFLRSWVSVCPIDLEQL